MISAQELLGPIPVSFPNFESRRYTNNSLRNKGDS